MINRRFLAIPALLTLALPLLAQRPQLRMVQLPINPPQAILGAQAVSHKAPADILHLAVSLPFADPAGAQQFADSVSDPKSPNYRHFATPEEIGRRFGQSETNVKKVSDYLTSQGMKVTLVAKNRLSILADATVAQAEKAFNVTISNFKTTPTKAVASETFFSYSTSPSMPAEISPYVIDVTGMENYTRPKARYETPTQIRTLYGVKPLYDAGNHGEGRNIAISNFDGFRISYVSHLTTQFGLPVPAGGAGSNITVKTVGTGAGAGDPGGEGDLDIQTIIAVAPLCNLYIYDSTNDIVGVLTLESNDNIADVISESYGWRFGSQSTALACHNIHVSMSGQGITYMAASGDTGTSVSDYPYPNYDPEVMMVGGTTVSTDASGNRTTETGWSGSGGGWYPSTDSFNKLPAWLNGPGIPTNINYRIFPDVALDADPNTGYVIYWGNQTYATNFYVFGGTSAASPTYAAGLADSEQKLISLGLLPADGAGKKRFGRIQDLLYSWAGDSSVFYDVTSGNNGTLPNGSSSNAVAGWDMVTGWGAFNFNGFVTKLSSSSKIASLTSNPTTTVGGSGTQLTFTVTLEAAAPAGGKVLTLASSDASVPVPASVTVAAGATTAQFSVTTTDVSTTKTVTVTVTGPSNSKTATVTVTPGPHPTTLVLTPASAVGGSSTSVSGKVTLDAVAPTGGMNVVLTSADTRWATVPATVLVPAGTNNVTFTVTHNSVPSVKTVAISAKSGGTTVSANLTLNPPSLSALKLTPGTTPGGVAVTGTVTLTVPAPAGGLYVAVAVSDTSAATLSTNSVKVSAGSLTGTFTVTPKAVDTAKTISVTATLASITKTASLNVKTPTVASIASSKTTAIGGVDSPTITVTLDGPAGPSGVTVAMSLTPSSTGTISSANLAIAAGSKTGTLTFTTAAVNVDTIAKITAVLSTSRAVNVKVTAAKLSTFGVNPTTGPGGTTVTGTVTLNAPAGPGGRVVTLVSSATALAVPASVTIAQGSTSATFTATPNHVTANKVVTLKAKLGTQVLSTTFTITP